MYLTILIYEEEANKTAVDAGVQTEVIDDEEF